MGWKQVAVVVVAVAAIASASQLWPRERDEAEPAVDRVVLITIDALRRDLGSEAFQAQYLQEPVPPGGNMFKREWIQRYTPEPRRASGDLVIQSWDTASKTGPENDWSVCTTWLRKESLHYLIHVFRAKLD